MSTVKEQLRSELTQLAGSASMCWEKVVNAGAFQSTEALKRVDEAMASPLIKFLLETADRSFAAAKTLSGAERKRIDDECKRVGIPSLFPPIPAGPKPIVKPDNPNPHVAKAPPETMAEFLATPAEGYNGVVTEAEMGESLSKATVADCATLTNPAAVIEGDEQPAEATGASPPEA